LQRSWSQQLFFVRNNDKENKCFQSFVVLERKAASFVKEWLFNGCGSKAWTTTTMILKKHLQILEYGQELGIPLASPTLRLLASARVSCSVLADVSIASVLCKIYVLP